MGPSSRRPTEAIGSSTGHSPTVRKPASTVFSCRSRRCGCVEIANQRHRTIIVTKAAEVAADEFLAASRGGAHARLYVCMRLRRNHFLDAMSRPKKGRQHWLPAQVPALFRAPAEGE